MKFRKFNIDLGTGVIFGRGPLPHPTPKQLGHPNWQDNGLVLQVWRAVITRLDCCSLEIRYPARFIRDDGNTQEDTSLSISVIYNHAHSKETRWEKHEGADAQAGFVPDPDYVSEANEVDVQVGLYKAFWEDGKLHFQSSDTLLAYGT